MIRNYLKSSNATPAAVTLAAVAVVQFMVSLDLSVMNVGLPQIGARLGFSPVGLTWVIDAYALAFGGLLLLGGKAADRYGRRRVLQFGLGLFGLASFLGGFAQAPGELIAARATQGIGAAATAPAALALLTTTFPAGRARVRAFGVWSAMNAAGGAVGVLLGGLLTQYASWRGAMFVSVPMAASALALTRRGVAADAPRSRTGRPDVLGAFLATAGLTLLVFGVVQTDRHPWASSQTVTVLAIAVAMLAAFVYVERTTTREPLIRLGLFANRSVAGANAFNLLVGAAMASAFYFVSLYLQRVLEIGPALTGLGLLPFALGVIAGSVLAIKLGARLAPRTLMVFGGLLTATGFAWFGLAISPDGAFVTSVLGPSIVASVGFGLCLGPVVSTATVGVAAHESGTAAALVNSSRQIGASLGLAALGTAAHDRTGGGVTLAALNDGYALGLTLCAVLLVAAVLVALTVLRQPRRASRAQRTPLRAMYLGLGLTVAATAVAHVDHATGNVLAEHIRAGYPGYTRARVDAAATTYLVCLTVVGALGVVSWLGTIWAVRAGKRWARVAAPALFALGTAVALTALLIKDTSGDTGLPPLLGWVGLLPCVAGLVAVTSVWRRTDR